MVEFCTQSICCPWSVSSWKILKLLFLSHWLLCVYLDNLLHFDLTLVSHLHIGSRSSERMCDLLKTPQHLSQKWVFCLVLELDSSSDNSSRPCMSRTKLTSLPFVKRQDLSHSVPFSSGFHTVKVRFWLPGFQTSIDSNVGILLGHYYQISRHFSFQRLFLSRTVSCWSDLWVLWKKSLPITGSLLLPLSQHLTRSRKQMLRNQTC